LIVWYGRLSPLARLAGAYRQARDVSLMFLASGCSPVCSRAVSGGSISRRPALSTVVGAVSHLRLARCVEPELLFLVAGLRGSDVLFLFSWFSNRGLLCGPPCRKSELALQECHQSDKNDSVDPGDFPPF